MVNIIFDPKTKTQNLESNLLKKYASAKVDVSRQNGFADAGIATTQHKYLLQGNLKRKLSGPSNLQSVQKGGNLYNKKLHLAATFTHSLSNKHLTTVTPALAANTLKNDSLKTNLHLKDRKRVGSNLDNKLLATKSPSLLSGGLKQTSLTCRLTSRLIDNKNFNTTKIGKNKSLVNSKLFPVSTNGTKVGEDSFGNNKVFYHDTIVKESLNLENITSEDIKFPTPSEINESKHSKSTSSESINYKIRLLSLASQSLINSPNWFNKDDKTRVEIIQLVEKLSQTDPEFILKVSMYTRCKLNIRTVANFLLALSAYFPSCRCYIKKYFNAVIKLPSDWTQVAELYQSITENIGKLQIPTALRKVMIKKFPDFDEHQLGKYNKSSGKSEAKKQKQRNKKGSSTKNEDDPKSTQKQPPDKIPRYTLKYLVQHLHIADPAYLVMSVLGKKYPDQNQFYRSRLSGIWESDKVGVRMKLAVPETWETMVSLHGNKAKVWEDLINNRKLPFMAMLRNLRNLIKAGISENHHKIVLKILKSERAVCNSKQFPYRFFSAFEVLDEMETDTESYELYKKKGVAAFLKGNDKSIFSNMKMRDFGTYHTATEDEKRIRRFQKQLHKKYKSPPMYKQSLLDDYKKALNESIKISSEHNIIPISGRTIIICDVNHIRMKKACSTAKGLGKPRELFEMGCLLGLMCMFSCESSVFKLFQDNDDHRDVEPELGGILSNLQSIISLVNTMEKKDDITEFMPMDFLKSTIQDGTIFDNMIMITSSISEDQTETFTKFMEKYRHVVNSNANFYEVNLASKRSSLENTALVPFYIKLHGFSDQILQYIALKEKLAQLREVDSIDKVFNLPDLTDKHPKKMEDESMIQQMSAAVVPWKRLKVFISSTFKDTNAERDYLIHTIFPMLKKSAASLKIHISEIDLRWGVLKQDDLYENVIACLKEVKKCDIFVGILGRRYGWVPKRDIAVNVAEGEFDWLLNYPTGRSITEMEIEQAIMDKKPCYFFMRDDTVYKDIPHKYFSIYQEKDKTKIKLLNNLKEKITKSGNYVQKYKCQWDSSNSKLCQVEDFGNSVYNVVWDKIQTCNYLPSHVLQSQCLHIVKCMTSVMSEVSQPNNTAGKIVVIAGKTGCGKSTILNYLENFIRPTTGNSLIIITEKLTKYKTASHLLLRLCEMLLPHVVGCDFKKKEDDFLLLCEHFKKLLKETMRYRKNVYILVDCFEMINPKCGRVEWIPNNLPPSVTIVISCLRLTESFKSLRHLSYSNIKFVNINSFTFQERRDLVTDHLKSYSKNLESDSWNNQMRELLAKQDSSNPLYLISACEFLRQFGSFENLMDQIKSLPKTLEELLSYQVLKVNHLFGKHSNIVLLLCAIILSSDKFSLKVLDLLDILTSYRENITTSLVFTVIHLLDSFFDQKIEHGEECVTFANGIHVQTITKLCWPSLLTKAHSLLAEYYIKTLGCGSTSAGDTSTLCSSLGRLTYHLVESLNFEVMETILLDVKFIFSKFKLSIGHQLRGDYNLYFSKSNDQGRLINPSVMQASEFINHHFGILKKTPGVIFQLALDEPEDSFVHSWATGKVNTSTVLAGDMVIIQCLSKKKLTSHSGSINVTEEEEYPTTVSSQDGNNVIYVGMSSGKVLAFDKNTGSSITDWKVHYSKITQLKYNSGYLAASSAAGHVTVWDIAKQKLLYSVLGHTKGVNDFAFVPAQQNSIFRSFVSVSLDRTFKVWNCSEDSSYIKSVKTDSIIANSIDYHPSLPRSVLGMWDGTLRIWEMNTSKRIAVLRGHKHSVSSAKYSPCGTYIASCSIFEKFVYLWSALHGTTVGKFIDNSISNPRSITFNDQLLVGFGQAYKQQDMHSIVTWKSYLGAKELDFQLTNMQSNALCTVYIQHLDMFAVGLHNGALVLFDTEIATPKYCEKIHTAMLTCIDIISKDVTGESHSIIVTGSADCSLKITIAAASGRHTHLSKLILSGHEDGVLSVACGKTWVASGAKDCSVYMWNVENINNGIRTKNKNRMTPSIQLRNHEAPVSCLTFKPGDDILVSCCRNGKLVFWEMQKSPKQKGHKPSFRAVKVKDNAHMDWITCCSWSELGDLIATGSNDSTIKLWSFEKILNKQPKACVKVIRLESSITSVELRKGCLLIGNGEGNSFEIWSHRGYQITKLETSNRANDCKFIFDDTKSNAQSDLFDGNSCSNQDWNLMVEQAEWEEEHDKHIPAKKTKIKAKKQKMEDFKAITVGNNSEISIWMPLVGEKSFVIDETKSQVTGIACMNSKIISVGVGSDVDMWQSQSVHEESFSFTSKVNCIYKINDQCIVTGCESGYIFLLKDEVVVHKRKAHDYAINLIIPFNKSSSENFSTVDVNGYGVMWKFIGGETPVLHKMEAFKKDYDQKLNVESDFSSVIGCLQEEEDVLYTDKGTVFGLQKPIKINLGLEEFITCAVKTNIPNLNGSLALGDSIGNVHIHPGGRKLKMHDKEITSIIDFENVLVTASYDGCLKVWSKATMKQSGFYLCRQPVTAMNKSCRDALHCGDVAGNVTTIKLRDVCFS